MKHSKTKTEAQSTQTLKMKHLSKTKHSKTKHPNLENEETKNSKTKTPKLETGLSFINWLESLLLIQQESSTIMNRMQFYSSRTARCCKCISACFGSDHKTENAQTISRMLLYGQEKPIRRQSSETNNKINTGYPI